MVTMHFENVWRHAGTACAVEGLERCLDAGDELRYPQAQLESTRRTGGVDGKGEIKLEQRRAGKRVLQEESRLNVLFFGRLREQRRWGPTRGGAPSLVTHCRCGDPLFVELRVHRGAERPGVPAHRL